ncbi:alpha-1,2-fucosyltransferase [Nocardioides hwasunensis]|uniref:Alpha-1,2-fucosyltransferase n=1 Tax=Nocardioides hwasunensis TaxID=397258 RepID=A0ABR8MLX5_9ACTN|nr:alpha-1,2-fucosyltransferase [Nocardioides hwasunensis]MBD3917006.1 alpha-1,2-fucosyltransferase [Nocardioides hwasunensis]
MSAVSRARSLAAGAVSPAITGLRNRLGSQVVNWTPEFMGFGNQLYLWAWAHARRDEAVPHRVLIVERSRYWLPFFPAVRPYLVERSDVGFWDTRDHFYAYKEEHSGDVRGYTDESRAAFVRDWILSSPALVGADGGELADDGVLTLNLRRGDFYSNPWFRSEYAFDVAAYVRLAVPRAIEQDGPVRRIHVVSDDIEWCRTHLGFLSSYAAEVTEPHPSSKPIDHLRDVSSSRRLVIANGTFSLWAAAMSRVLLDAPPRTVWVPAFFQRRYGPGRCEEYDQDWSFVDDLPGGWQPDWVVEGLDHDPAQDASR